MYAMQSYELSYSCQMIDICWFLCCHTRQLNNALMQAAPYVFVFIFKSFEIGSQAKVHGRKLTFSSYGLAGMSRPLRFARLG